MLVRKRPLRTILSVGLLALSLPLLAQPAVADTGPAPVSKQRTVLNDVHTDAVDVQYTGGRLALGTRVGNAPHQFFTPSDVLFQVKDNDSARIAIPDAGEYAFLGAAGTPVWIAPQVQDFSLLFAGWDTESLQAGTFAGDAVDLRLVGVDGPGAVEVFQSDSFGLPVRVFSSSDPAYKSLHQGVGSHVHANWSFSAGPLHADFRGHRHRCRREPAEQRADRLHLARRRNPGLRCSRCGHHNVARRVPADHRGRRGRDFDRRRDTAGRDGCDRIRRRRNGSRPRGSVRKPGRADDSRARRGHPLAHRALRSLLQHRFHRQPVRCGRAPRHR